MPLKDDSPVSRAQTSYQKLAAAASNLNTASDQLGKVVVDLDSALKRLNLGITSWVFFSGWQDDPDWASDYIGYAKIGGKWGIAIRSLSSDFSSPDGCRTDGEWLFNDAPRDLRLMAIDKIPDLLEKLVEKVGEFTSNLNTKLKQSQELSTAISALARGTDKTAKGSDAVPPPPTFDDIKETNRIPDGPPPFTTGMIAGMGMPPGPPTFDSAKGMGAVPPPPHIKGIAGLALPGKNKK